MAPKKKKQAKEPDVEVPEGDIGAGKAIFSQHCAVCHAMQGDGKSAAAPVLGGVIGRQVGSTNFNNSKALKGAGFIWTEKHLFMYLLNPAKYISGNKMSFAGLQSETDRANIIAYLKST